MNKLKHYLIILAALPYVLYQFLLFKFDNVIRTKATPLSLAQRKALCEAIQAHYFGLNQMPDTLYIWEPNPEVTYPSTFNTIPLYAYNKWVVEHWSGTSEGCAVATINGSMTYVSAKVE